MMTMHWYSQYQYYNNQHEMAWRKRRLAHRQQAWRQHGMKKAIVAYMAARHGIDMWRDVET